MSRPANLIIRGSGWPEFARAILDLYSPDFAANMVWSSAIDKYGDWLISTEDDPDVELLRTRLAQAGIESYELYEGGELTSFTADGLLKEHGAKKWKGR